MKKILLLAVIICSMNTGAQPLPTDDYLYATELRYDDYEDLMYFNVCLNGSTFYAAYGVDIQLPQGLEVDKTTKGLPNVVMIDDEYQIDEDIIYPYEEGRKGFIFTHSVTPSFPSSTDLSHIRIGCMSSQNEDLKAESGALFRVYVNKTCSSNQWPIGAIKLYDAELTTIVEEVVQGHTCPDKETVIALYEGESSLPLTVSATNHWSTCILPFATAIPAGVKAYTSSTSDSENIYLTEANSIEAYTPYILYSENGYSGNVSGTVDASGYPESGIVTAGNLTGAIVPQTVTSGYILQKQNDVVQFYAIASGDSFLVPAGKCWMNIAGNNAKTFNFVVEDDETAIRSISSTTADDATYDLTGRRISTTKQGGIYIKNGKKVMK